MTNERASAATESITPVIGPGWLSRAFVAHGPVLLAAARAIVHNESEAEDLVQTTFEIAARRVNQVRDPDALRAWLLTIEAREAFRLVRRLRRIVALDGHVTAIVVPGPSASEAALRIGLSHLPPRVRAAIVLHHLGGLSVDETAAALGTKPNTIKSQLRDGLDRLRRELRDE